MQFSWLIVLIGSLFIIPAVVQGATASTSSSPGFLLAAIAVVCLILVFTRAKLIKLPHTNLLIKAILLLGFFTQIIRLILAEPSTMDLGKIFYSFPLILALFLSAQALATLVVKSSHKVDFANLSTAYVSIFILLGIFSFFAIRIPSLFSGSKQVVFFSEPSHYVMALTPLLITSLCVSRSPKVINIIQITFLIVLSFLLESVTLAAAILFSLLVCFVMYYNTPAAGISYKRVASLICIGIIGSLIGIFISRNNYFMARLNFVNINITDSSSISSNISLLMGYEEAYLNLLRSSFTGLGFQQMGILEPSGNFANAIASTYGEYINRFDGSILASKIISEFGFAGILLIATYLLFCFKIILASGSKNLSQMQRFSIGLIVSLVPYLFFRGGGYFSGSVVISLAGFFALWSADYRNIFS